MIGTVPSVNLASFNVSVTSILFNVVLPVFVTVTLNVTVSSNLYASPTSGVSSTVFSTNNPFVSTVSVVIGSSGSVVSLSPAVTILVIAPSTFSTLVVNVNSTVSPAGTVTSVPAINLSAVAFEASSTSKIPLAINSDNFTSLTFTVAFSFPVFLTETV